MLKFNAKPVFIAISIQAKFITGSIPGIPESMKFTFSLGSDPN